MLKKFTVFFLLMGILLNGCVINNPLPPERDPGVFFVSPSGDDSNDGLSTNTAFATIQHALDNLASGDVVYILAGSYYETTWVYDRSFNSQVSIQAQPGAVLDGTNSWYEGILIENVSCLELSGITVHSYKVTGINVLNSSRITLRDCLVYDNGFDSSDYDWGYEGYGINAKYSSYLLISNNTVYRNGPSLTLSDTYGSLGTGINTYALSDSRIVDNLSHSNRGGGILVEDSHRVLVTGNSAHHNTSVTWLNPADHGLGIWSCAGMWLDGGDNITVSNNSFGLNRIGIIAGNEDNQVISGFVVKGNSLFSNSIGVMIQNISSNTSSSILELGPNTFFTNGTNIIW